MYSLAVLDRLCLRKEEGGTGFRYLHHFNLALLVKHGWNLVAQPHSLASCVLKANYFPHRCLCDAM